MVYSQNRGKFAYIDIFKILFLFIVVPLILILSVSVILDASISSNSWMMLVIAIFLGIKHSFDVDHLVAVSNLLISSKNLKKAVSLSFSWALGHMFTATLITIILFIFRDSIFSVLFENIEFIIPLMLIIISLITLAIEFNILQFHKHEEQSDKKFHKHEEQNEKKIHDQEQLATKHMHGLELTDQKKHKIIAGIGIIQGIASNDELLILLTITLGFLDLNFILIGVFFFTIGVVIGMIAYTILLNYPINKFGQKRVTKTVNIVVALLSIGYSVYLLIGLEGLNFFEFFA